MIYTSMRILFLDDERKRTESFLKEFPNAHTCKTAKECIALLEKNKYDFIFLDHDLGLGNGTGSEVAEFMNTMNMDNRPKSVIIHSFNPIGANRMYGILGRKFEIIRQPFNITVFKRILGL